MKSASGLSRSFIKTLRGKGNVWSRFVLFSCLAAVAVIIMLISIQQYRAMINTETGRMTNMHSVRISEAESIIASRVDYAEQSIIALSVMISKSKGFDDEILKRHLALAATYLHSVDLIFYYDTNGWMCRSRPTEELVDARILGRVFAWMEVNDIRGLRHGKMTYTPIVKVAGQTVMGAIYPVIPQSGNSIGAVMALIDIDKLTKTILPTLNKITGGPASMLNADGSVISFTGNAETPQFEYGEFGEPSGSNISALTGPGGESEYICSWKSLNIGGNTVYLTASSPYLSVSEMTAPLKSQMIISAAAVAILVGVSMLITRNGRTEQDRQTNRIMDLIFECAGCSGWLWYPESGAIMCGAGWSHVYKTETVPSSMDDIKQSANQGDIAAMYKAAEESGDSRQVVDIRMSYEDGTSTVVRNAFRVLEKLPSGKPLCVFGISHNIDEITKAEKELKASRSRIETLFNEGTVGIAIMAPDNSIHEMNPRMLLMLRAGNRDTSNFDSSVIIAPEYHKRRLHTVEAMNLGALDEVNCDIEYLRCDGSRFWATSALRAVRNEDGCLEYMADFVTDITTLKDAEDELRKSLAKMDGHAQKLGSLHSMMRKLGVHRNNTSMLSAAVPILKEIMGCQAVGIYSVNDSDVQIIGENGPRTLSLEEIGQRWSAVARDEHLGNYIYLPIVSDDVMCAMAVLTRGEGFEPISEKLANIAMEQLSLLSALNNVIVKREMEATVDPLTGLWNRRYVMGKIRDECKRVLRYGGCMSIAILDMGNFKQVNDTMGHMAGDRVLISCAEVILANVRDSDTVGRFGGDEFICLLSETTDGGADVVMDRIQRSVAAMEIEGDTGIRLTVDYGLASFPGDSDDIEECIRMADNRMYINKRDRKNRAQG